jgi:polyphosphate glucokinase
MSQHPVRKGKSYDQYIGHAALESVGKRHWNRRVQRSISILKTVVNYDTLYLGGGNAKLIRPPLPDDVKIVSNEAGLTGGVRLWDRRMDDVFAARPPAFETMPATKDSSPAE